MRDMGELVRPVHDLGGGDGQGLEARLGDPGGDEQGPAVEEEIELAVVVEVEGRRPVVDILKNRAQDAHPQRNRPVEAVLQAVGEQEITPDLGDVRDSEDREAQVEAVLPEGREIRGFTAHGATNSKSPLPGCQTKKT